MWHWAKPAVLMVAVAVVLSLAFIPEFFNGVAFYDDEGSLFVAVQRFLAEGSLYDHTHGSYGPFYFSVYGLIFKASGVPTLFTGRVIMMSLTLLTVVVFGAAVFKVTRSLTLSILCEVATFVVLVPSASNQAMHPGSLIALILAVLAYALAGYAMDRRTVFLVVIGATVGALLMTKINVGLFAAAAVVAAFVVGNQRYPGWMRVVVAVGALALPFAITSQLLYQTPNAQFALLVSIALLATFTTLHADPITIPPSSLLVIAEGLVGVVLASWIWPLLHGTSVRALLVGVVIQPLGQADNLSQPVPVYVGWFAIVLTFAACYAVLARRRLTQRLDVRPRWLLDGALALAGLWVLGLGVFGGVAAWLPAIAILPALMFLGETPRKTRVAMRFLVPMAILQLLHVYPVPGAQLIWGRVAMCVPCVIAVAAGWRRLPFAREMHAPARVLAVGSLCALVALAGSVWPVASWHKYLDNESLDVSGTRMIRVDSATATALQELTGIVQQNCDTFYGAPGFGSLYVYTGLPTPTGQLANFPGALNDREQRDIASQLEALENEGKRVCIVRDHNRESEWQDKYGIGPLGDALANYRSVIGQASSYSVARRGLLTDQQATS